MAATTQDLLEVHTGVMGERLRKIVRMGMKHVKQCLVSEGIIMLLLGYNNNNNCALLSIQYMYGTC